MSSLNNLMCRGIIPPVVHGVLDYPLAAVVLVCSASRPWKDWR